LRIDIAIDKANVIFAEEAKNAKSDEKTKEQALKNLREWLTDEKFREYKPTLLELIDLAAVDKSAAKELYDSFWRTIPFGTGGRRWRMGIGPNRMNAYMAAMTAQGHVEYLKAQYPEEVKRGDAVAGAWDVRAFHKYFAETPSLKKYREVIEARCPVLAGLSSEGLSKIVALVYAGNGITYLHSNEMRSTPWLSFIVNRFNRVVGNHPFTGKAGEALNKIQNVMAGIVLSSSHNPFDNNGTKFYENSGAQAPPQIVQKLMDLGDKVQVINYYKSELYYQEGLERAFEEAVRDGKVVVLENDTAQGINNLETIDRAYTENAIEEILSYYTPEERRALQVWFKQLLVSYNALNGTGVTNLLPILKQLEFGAAWGGVLRSTQDVPTWEFPEGYGNIPNPEAEKSFNTAMQIGVRRTLDWIYGTKVTTVKAIIDEDNQVMPMENLVAAHGNKPFTSAEELINFVGEKYNKYIRGLVLDISDQNDTF
jgi:hypothetical protein